MAPLALFESNKWSFAMAWSLTERQIELTLKETLRPSHPRTQSEFECRSAELCAWEPRRSGFRAVSRLPHSWISEHLPTPPAICVRPVLERHAAWRAQTTFIASNGRPNAAKLPTRAE